MAAFIKFEDSPMFHKEVRSLEQNADELRDRCQKLHRGCTKYTEVLGEACNGDLGFAAALEAFGGGLDDLLGVSIGGPVLSKFINALRELATYKEFLRSQVEHVLVDCLSQFLTVDLQDAKDSRRRFDKATYAYDQTREKCASLKKTSRDEVIAELEEDLQNSKSAYERSRFNLVHTLTNIEAKKKFEFLESFSAVMDAHLRFFKLGYELLKEMEPFFHQVLTYAIQSKELANIEQDKLAKRIQEFRTQSELNHLKAADNLASSNVIGLNDLCMASYQNIEAITLATSKGEVNAIKQGYLLKRSSSLRADWKRRFFVLDSRGTLFYYRNKGAKPVGVSPSFPSYHSLDQNSRVFGRFRSRHNRNSSYGDDSLGYTTVDLHTSKIKIDAEDTDLRLCFRIISPSKTYTLQAETEADRIDWMNKITGVTASLLNSHLQQLNLGKNDDPKGYNQRGSSFSQSQDGLVSAPDTLRINREDSVSRILREVPGNDQCAECSAPQPDWASLNLGILMCIECSGIHRNLGVHVSKVRSVTLDVKVWDQTILDLFQVLGNTFCNSVWEELLPLDKDVSVDPEASLLSKPSHKDPFHLKEKYIQSKYMKKLFVRKAGGSCEDMFTSLWEGVKSNNLREVYHIGIASDANLVNRTFGGLSLVHLACDYKNSVMVELLVQLGCDINIGDVQGRSPVQYCILKGNNDMAKFLLRRGARASVKDAAGFTALETAMEMGSITDEELFVLLTET